MKILILLLSICPTLTTFAQITEKPGRPVAFIKIERIGEPTGISFFVFSTTDYQYTIRNDGLIENQLGTIRRSFPLKMGGHGKLDRVYMTEYEGDVLLAYAVTNGGSNWGYVARLNQKTRAFRWVTPVSSPNVGPGLIEDSFLYITSHSNMAKLDLQSGEYIWQTQLDNQNSPAFVEFLLPELRTDRIVFRESGQRMRVLELDKLTGKVLK
jgi:outer membrane protein assembly factor BamB